MKPIRPTYANIDLKCIRENYLYLHSLLAGDMFFCPMVKANAYGHGDVEVARELQGLGAPSLGVGLVEEGLRLREHGITAQLLVFGVIADYGLNEICKSNLTPVLSEFNSLYKYVEEVKSPLKVHLKFNTGMNRLGFSIDNAEKVFAKLAENQNLQLEGICTHLLKGDDIQQSNGITEEQLRKFAQVLKKITVRPLKVHSLNGVALLNLESGAKETNSKRPHFSHELGGARPGLALYGIQMNSPGGEHPQLKPVLSWHSQIMQVREIKSGESVSYSANWKAKKNSIIGVLPVGYADGFSRLHSNQGQVLVRGIRAPVIGSVCMDYFMIDLTEVCKKTGPVNPREEVVLIGKQGADEIRVYEWASSMGTIPYEVLTCISSRVPRNFMNPSEKWGQP